MTVARSWLGAALVFFGIGAAGCGIGVQVTTDPTNPAPGQPVTINVKLTNASICPAPAQTVAVVPFLTQEEIEDEIGGDLEFNLLFQLACTGQLNFDGISCVLLPGGIVECTIENGALPEPSTAEPNQSSESPITCERSETETVCRAQISDLEELLGKLMGGDGSPISLHANGNSCIPSGEGFLCQSAPLAAGAMTTLQLIVPAPTSGGPFFTLAFAITGVTGVCAGGADAGDVCLSDSDCDSNNCADSICVGGSNPGHGCDDPGDCTGGTCQPCVADSLPPVFTTALPLGCLETDLGAPAAAPAPALSTPGKAAAAVMLLLLGVGSLMRMRRRSI